MGRTTDWMSLVVFGMLFCACQMRGLEAEPLAASVEKPSNVALYLRVQNDGEPATDLTVSHFSIHEDDQRLEPDKVGLTLLDRDESVAHGTLLLIDVSGSSEEQTQSLARAAAKFVEQVQKTQPVWIYTFDGSEEIAEAGSHERQTEASPLGEIEGIAQAASSDASRNLHGAVVQGLETLAVELAQNDKPVRVGTLVVFTAGPDLAGRVSPEQMELELERSRHRVYAVTLEGARLGAIDRRHVEQAQSVETAERALSRIGSRVQKEYKSYYLLSYCSPARAGQRTLRVEVDLSGAGGRRRSTRFETTFHAGGFSGGCDSSTPPGFRTTMLFDEGEPVPSSPPGATPPTSSTKPAKRQARPSPRPRAAPRRQPPPQPKPEPEPSPEPPPPADDFQP